MLVYSYLQKRLLLSGGCEVIYDSCSAYFRSDVNSPSASHDHDKFGYYDQGHWTRYTDIAEGWCHLRSFPTHVRCAQSILSQEGLVRRPCLCTYSVKCGEVLGFRTRQDPPGVHTGNSAYECGRYDNCFAADYHRVTALVDCSSALLGYFYM